LEISINSQYGFDGEDFIAFNSDTLQWIDKNPKAKETKMKWDQQTKHNELLQHFLKTCMNWISTFNNTQKTPPDVHVFVRKAPDDHSGTCFDSETMWPVIVGVAVVAVLVSACWLCVNYTAVIGSAVVASWNPSLNILNDEQNGL
ncbi:hypothetical protein cypCar_00042819, partial [Cyprinus carpio]